MAVFVMQPPVFMDRKIQLPDQRVFEIITPLTDYRACHDGTPLEARMVFTCKQNTPDLVEEEFILKVKVQLAAEGQIPAQGPSTTTAAEIQALEIFREAKTPFAPHLVAFHCEAQNDRGPLPGGFITYTIMTKIPGLSLFGRYWSMSTEERAVIVPKAVEALRSIYDLGVEPGDRGLRNVMWDPETKACGIVDFELWSPINGTFANEKNEMQRWGLLRSPPAKDHFVAFQMMYRN